MGSGRILTISVLCFCLMAIVLSFKTPDNDGQGFKNLKILPKTITKKQLDSVMGYYALSLGVRCGFCHARMSDTTKRGLDFASDAKPEKGIAREMMQMTANLNANYFNFSHSAVTDTIHTVTCYTCHRGNSSPSYQNLLPDYNAAREKMYQERQKRKKE